MWRPAMVLLGLIAALAGTPLRQAEAASDFARALAAFGQGHLIENVDGGVGDDSGATILKAGDESHSLPATTPPAPGDALLKAFFPALDRLQADGCRWLDPTARMPEGSARRLAWLQCFLF